MASKFERYFSHRQIWTPVSQAVTYLPWASRKAEFGKKPFHNRCVNHNRTLLISMRMENVSSSRKLQRTRLGLYAVTLSSVILLLASRLAIMSETSTNNAGKHWTDDEVDHMLDRLAEWRTVGKVGDGGNFTGPAFTAVCQYLATKGYTRTSKQCISKWGTVRIFGFIFSIIAHTHQLSRSSRPSIKTSTSTSARPQALTGITRGEQT